MLERCQYVVRCQNVTRLGLPTGTTMTRGLQKKPLKSIKLDNGKYVRSEQQKIKDRTKRIARKMAQMKVQHRREIERLEAQIAVMKKKSRPIGSHNHPTSFYDKITNESIVGFRELQPEQLVKYKMPCK